MSSNHSVLKGCLVVVGVMVLLAVLVAIFGVKAVNKALERANEHAQQIEAQQRDTKLPPILPVPSDEEDPGEDGAHDPPGAPGDGESATSIEIARRWNLPPIPVTERGNTSIKSFRSAKNVIYDTHRDLKMEKTFYCGCDYKRRKPVHKSCGYAIRQRKDRARRTEVEHVMPASRFGHTFTEWTEGHPDCERKGRAYKGRSCAEETSEPFSMMASDLYNLQPAIGEVNGDRLDYEWAELTGEEREYGKCDIEIRDQKVEPARHLRGDIARTYLYMAWAYPSHVTLSEEELEMFARWDRDDPVSRDELRRAEALSREQGNVQALIVGR